MSQQEESPYLAVKEIWQHDERTLNIIWTDLKESRYDVVELRRNCPCALCVDELTGKRKFKDSDIAESVRPTRISSVGRYAVKIDFSDKHNTGLYSFERLRSLTH